MPTYVDIQYTLVLISPASFHGRRLALDFALRRESCLPVTALSVSDLEELATGDGGESGGVLGLGDVREATRGIPLPNKVTTTRRCTPKCW